MHFIALSITHNELASIIFRIQKYHILWHYICNQMINKSTVIDIDTRRLLSLFGYVRTAASQPTALSPVPSLTALRVSRIRTRKDLLTDHEVHGPSRSAMTCPLHSTVGRGHSSRNMRLAQRTSAV